MNCITQKFTGRAPRSSSLIHHHFPLLLSRRACVMSVHVDERGRCNPRWLAVVEQVAPDHVQGAAIMGIVRLWPNAATAGWTFTGIIRWQAFLHKYSRRFFRLRRYYKNDRGDSRTQWTNGPRRVPLGRHRKFDCKWNKRRNTTHAEQHVIWSYFWINLTDSCRRMWRSSKMPEFKQLPHWPCTQEKCESNIMMFKKIECVDLIFVL